MALIKTSVLMIVAACAGPVLAQTWDGGGTDNNWSTANNWSGNVVPVNNGTANITMAGTTRLTSNVNANYNIAGLSFASNAGAFSLTGDILTLGAGGIAQNSANAQTISAALNLNADQTWATSSGDLTVSGLVAGSAALNKAGVNTLTLSGSTANTFTGTTTISTGTLILNKTNGVAALGGNVFVNGGTLNFDQPNNLGAESIITVSSGLSTIHFGGSPVMGGLLFHNGGYFWSGGPFTLTGTATDVLSFNGADFPTVSANFNFTGSSGGGITNLDPHSSIYTGTFDFGGIARAFDVNDGTDDEDIIMSGVIANGGVIKNGPGTLAFSGTSANTYSLRTTVNDGTLILEKTGATAIQGNLTINSPGIVLLGASQQISAAANTITINGGTLNLASFSQTTQSTLTLSGGTVTGGTLDLNGNVSVPAGGGASTISSNIQLGTGTKTIDVEKGAFPDSTALTLTGKISGSGGLLLTSASGASSSFFNVNFAGATSNTFTGGTTVQTSVNLQNAAGTVALPGPVTIGSPSAGGVITLSVDNPIATSASLTVYVGSFLLDGSRGFSQTVANFNFDGYLGTTLILAPGGTGLLGPDSEIAAYSATLVNNGTLTIAGGHSDGVLENNGVLLFTASPTFDPGFGSIVNNGIFTLPTGITITGGTGTQNFGVITLAGGTLGGIDNENSITGFGTNTDSGNGYGFLNNGYISVTGGILHLSSVDVDGNAGNIDIQSDGKLELGSALNNGGAINLLGGSISYVTGGSLTNAVAVNGRGTISAPLTNFGTIQPENGSLNITTAFTNNGIIQLTSGSSLLGGDIANANAIQGNGTVANNVTNSGTIEPTGGTLIFSGVVSNTGLIRIATGNEAFFQNFPTNAGTISLTGGTLATSAGQPLNNTGSIVGYGVISTGGLTNNNILTLTGGTSTINGPVTNAAGKTINVKYQPAVFTGNITNNGTIKVTGTTVTYTGSYTGNAYISDPATNIFQNNVTITPGGSMTGGSGDVYNFSTGSIVNHGNFTNGGALLSDDNITNTGTFTQTGPQTWGVGTSFTNTGTASFGSDAGTNGANLSIDAVGGLVTFDADQHLVSLSITDSATVDVTGQELFISSAPLATIRSNISAAYDKGAWDLPGLTSSLAGTNRATAVGYEDAGDQTIVKYTWYGDADLNGVVNASDFSAMAASGTTDANWQTGDFNYDGIVNGDDYALLMLGEAESGGANITTTVPEPASPLLVGLIGLGPMYWRRRHSAARHGI